MQTDTPGYQNFVTMPAAVFDLIQEHIYHHIKKNVTNLRKSIKVGLKLAITLRHLATEETYTGNRLKRSSKSDGISPNPLGALDRKHIAMKMPKRSGNKYYNYNGFFSLVLLAHCRLRLQIPLSRCWGKWIFIRCTNI